MDIQNNQNINKNIATGVVWKFAERLFSQGVSFIVSVILARLLVPEDYGVVAIVIVFIEIANVFVISGLNTALIQKKNINETEISTIFYCGVILSVLLYIIMFLAAPFIASAYNNSLITSVIRVFALRVPISSIQQVPSALISRKLDFKKFFFSTMVGVIVSAAVGIIMALKGFGVWSLVAQNLVAAVLDAAILSIVSKWTPKRKFSLREAAPLIIYGSKIMATDLIGTVFNNLNSMIIGLRYNSADLAYYTKGKTLPQMFRNNIYTTLISVLFPVMSKVGDDPQQVKAVAKRSIKMLAYIIFPMMLGMICVAEDLVIFLYTEKWILMAPFITIVCIECMISIIPTIVLQTLKATGHSGIILKLEFVKKPILLVSILISINFGVNAVAWTLPINTLIELVLNSLFSAKIIDYSISEQFKDILSPLLLSFGMGAVILFVNLINMNVLLSLVLKILVGIGVYVLFSVIFKVQEFNTLIGFIKSKIRK
ncbi:MAG: lipopolysaccharide biosynthesis protein [Acutalibacteraceae bacterium]|nr:lipopolysaccharide biosynthesis protein [Acutalibacteraceae bacterium]